ncbi:hypothetical protein BDQ12DRAFT_727724 [Crucibulum laeve]|uniref:Uncharacterized protein n=1 Tax=Crucibulum laeve TaxID=68775 RepID=A0A5C3LMJ2_9AGAR|nr:hypothetical protein BDQ12DRAFT_727724 [Crucibulum laeve]
MLPSSSLPPSLPPRSLSPLLASLHTRTCLSMLYSGAPPPLPTTYSTELDCPFPHTPLRRTDPLIFGPPPASTPNSAKLAPSRNTYQPSSSYSGPSWAGFWIDT